MDGQHAKDGASPGLCPPVPWAAFGGSEAGGSGARPGPPTRELLPHEPLSALDVGLRQDIRVELKQQQEETGIIFIFGTHDQEEALAMSDRIAVKSAGRVLHRLVRDLCARSGQSRLRQAFWTWLTIAANAATAATSYATAAAAAMVRGGGPGAKRKPLR